MVLYILGGIALLVAIALFLPISVSLKFNKELTYKVKLAGFKVYPKFKEQQKEPDKAIKTSEKEKNFFEVLKEKHGFAGAVKEVFAFAKDCINPIKRFLRFVSFKNVRLSLKILGDDAAKTAFDYGIVCAAVYPVLSFVEGLANVNYKKVDVTADFEGKESEFEFSLKIKSSVIFIFIFLVRVFNEYKKFSVRNGLQ